MTTTTVPDRSVKLGPRIYNNTNWTREDAVFLGTRKIGVIKLNSKDRAGRTISLITKKTVIGRQLDWCVAQASLKPQSAPVARISQARPVHTTPEQHSRL